MASAELSTLHILGHFDNEFAGAERELPDLAKALAGRRRTALWSDVQPHPAFARQGVRAIRAFAQEFPKGGMLLIGGVHVRLDVWLRHMRPERVALRYNLPNHGALFERIEQIREATGLDPELLFVSGALQSATGLPGTLERSFILLEPYLRVPLQRAPRERFTVGRVSRDTPGKHGADDPALYRMLAASGMRVRIMGGTCLRPQLQGVEGVELLAQGAEDVVDFYASLDAMFYRTGSFQEPYGRVVFEAMAAGLPVVADARGGYAEFIGHGESGLLVRSQEEAVNALGFLAVNPQARLQMGAAARARALELHGGEAARAALEMYLR